MEISVGFADKDTDYISNGYVEDESEVGKVYIPAEGVAITGPIGIRYEKHPWIEKFEVDGIVPLRPKRTGVGSKNFVSFVQSLNTIYARAYDDYDEFCEPAGYFAHVTGRFVREYSDESHGKLFRLFSGYVENMWREGNQEMYDVAMRTILPIIKEDDKVYEKFWKNITEEFKEYIQGVEDGKEA